MSTTAVPTSKGPPGRDARRAMLDEIRSHLAAGSAGAASPSAPGDHAGPPSSPTSAGQTTGSGVELVERFRQAIDSVAGRCTVVVDMAAAAEAVQAILDVLRPRRVVLSDAWLVRSVVDAVATDAEVLVGAGHDTLFSCDVGITSAQWAVAETGTLVLDSSAEGHRLASLVPPVHIALVAADRVRPTMGSVLAELARVGRDHLGRCITFITGPSRTSDIELTLAIGVHGPGELHVIVIEHAPSDSRTRDSRTSSASM